MTCFMAPSFASMLIQNNGYQIPLSRQFNMPWCKISLDYYSCIKIGDMLMTCFMAPSFASMLIQNNGYQIPLSRQFSMP